MKTTSSKPVWHYFSLLFLFVFLITIGAKVQAKDVASGTELKQALAQGESSITVTSPMLTLPKNTDITHDVTINFNNAVLFFEDNQTPALMGKNNCAVRIQNAFVTHDTKKNVRIDIWWCT